GDVLRRGQPAVWKEHGVSAAILLGDALHSDSPVALSASGAGLEAGVSWAMPVFVQVGGREQLWLL
ncbi:hypothetical protein AB0I53_48255, partial [Saccharopolyspora sp. NPDC050389]